MNLSNFVEVCTLKNISIPIYCNRIMFLFPFSLNIFKYKEKLSYEETEGVFDIMVCHWNMIWSSS